MRAIYLLAGLSILAGVGFAAGAADFPTRPIRLVVAHEAGSTIDIVGRVVAAQINKQSGINVVVEAKPGANSLIATADVAKSEPDGYTLLNISPSFVINPYIYKSVPYDLKSFVPVSSLAIGTGYMLVVRQGLPVNSVAELIALARNTRQGLTYGSPGIGNALHLAAAGFAKKAGVDMLHVPYKGSSGALNAIAAGQVDVLMLSPSTVGPYVQSGKIRLIAFTGEQRSKEFPDVPTMKEAGVDDFVIMGTWVGWFAPAGTPADVVRKLADEVAKAVKDPQVAATLRQGGFEPDGRSPEAFAEFVKKEALRYSQVVKDARVELQ